MIKVDKLIIDNFRFFNGLESLEFDSKNTLIYGENGSGKSSIFKAFEFLRDLSQDDMLENFRDNKNIFNLDRESFIEFRLNNGVNIKIDENFKLERYKFIDNFFLINPLLDYKKLLHINFSTNLEYSKINIFPMVERLFENYPLNNGVILGKIENPNEKLEELKVILNSLKDDINLFLTKFTTEFYIKKFVYTTDYIPIAKKLGLNNLLEFVINIEIDFKNIDIKEYHTFLNEARLSSLAIAIYFAIIKSLSKIDNSNILKTLVLDDLLISLDMSNRNRLLSILKNDFSDFQIIFLTHDRTLFEFFKDSFDKKIEIFVDNSGEFEKPFILTSKSYIEKSKQYLIQGDLECSGNFLRKALEEILNKKLGNPKDINCKNLSLNELFAKAKQKKIPNILELEKWKKHILNSASHHDIKNLHRFEVEQVIALIEKLRG